ncbi:MAG TPA: methyltransferase domain-containing protein [Acidimicrobiales bacterium]|nr:methyltransferase domain-containing protein [Acidimicrobiales bacterium]
MDLDPSKQTALDATLTALTEELRAAGDGESAVTLAYTHSLHRMWRTALRLLPLPRGSSVLDVGSGLGILAFELAANLDVHVQGVDIDPRFVGHSMTLLERLDDEGLFTEGSTVHFGEGDIRKLAFDDDSFDLAFVRELLQFLPDPVEAVGEVYRVVRPGGYACVSDTDDQLHITWPEHSQPLARLVGAVSSIQYSRGGDRQCGRKLSTYLRHVGFDIASVVVLPEAQHRVVDALDGERSLVLEQLRSARQRIVQTKTMTAEAFDADLALVEEEEPHEEFRMNARIIVLAQKPST